MSDSREPSHSLRPPLHNSSSPRDKEPKDLDKIQKWQEERIARRLQGEYESAVLHLQEVLDGNSKTPLTISSVRVENAKTTRHSFLASLITPIMNTSSTPSSAAEGPRGTTTPGQSNLESVLHTTRSLSEILQKTGIFTHIDAKIERAQNPLSPLNSVDIVFRTKERGRWSVTSATELGNNEGSANASATIRNVFGGAETFTANASLGTKTKRSYSAALNAPLTADLNTFGNLSVYGLDRDQTSYASCYEGLRGLRATVKGSGPQGKGLHEMGYEAVFRHIHSLTPKASHTIRLAAGESLKSSIFHSYIYDTRDDRIAATRGAYLKLYHEFAGVGGGDAAFYKTEVESQVSRKTALEGVSCSVAAKCGLLWGLRGRDLLFSDRFQLGGPTSVRSFKMNGLGPHDGADSIGGDIFYSVGASIVSNIPKKPDWPVKAHLWVNTGRLDQVDRSRPLVENVKDILTKPSISAGVGLIYRFDPVRVEVNFGVPLVASQSDGTRKGIQVGVGLEFI